MAGLVAKAGGSDATPDGKYFAKLIGIYDIGTQPSDKYDPTHQCVMTWLLYKKGGVPVLVKDDWQLKHSQYFGLGMGINKQNKQKSRTRLLVEGMLNRALSEDEAREGYDLFEFIDQDFRVQILDGKITSIQPCDEDDPELKTDDDAVTYLLDPEEPIPGNIPEWVQRAIERSAEWVKVNGRSGKDSSSTGGGSGRRNGRTARKPAAAAAGSGRARTEPADDDDDEDDDIPF